MLANVWGKIDRKGWRLLIVGPDDRGYTYKMKQLFSEKCLAGGYEFRNPVFGKDKFELLSSADAFILPTRSENWSIAVAEAMASGLPVICTKGAPWECLNQVKAGWWVDVSESGLIKGLEALFALSEIERCEFGGRGRTWVESNLGWKVIAGKMIQCYSDIINQQK